MKKLLFGLIATVMFGFVGNAQSKSDIEQYSVVKSEKITVDNPKIKDFLTKTKFFELNPTIKFDNLKLELQTFKNSSQGLYIPLINSEFNTLYVYMFEGVDGYAYNFISTKDEKTYTFSNDKVLLYTGSNNKGNTLITYNPQARSAFGQCMDAVEDDFTDDLVGWVAWNTHPGIQALAAGMCYSCVKWGRACPAAYQP
ncbi:hypothetical protein [Flavobacterium sp.]|jgi:hypothetical protein|uniref:hypothetical protein n=1 Tax=Flavobacterium sp. TaxID=239 RepID=UPI0037BFC3FB